MLRISQLKLPVEHTEAQLKKKLLKTAHIKEQDLKQFLLENDLLTAGKTGTLLRIHS